MSNNYGQGSIGNYPKQRAPGAPFVSGSADNGLSVDPVTGRIVLGNDFGGTSAALTNQREIPLAGNGIQFSDNLGSNANVNITPGSLNVNHNVFAHFAQISSNVSGALLEIISDNTDPAFFAPSIRLGVSGVGPSTFKILNDSGIFEIADNTNLPNQNRFISIDPTNGAYFFGDIDLVGNGNILFIDDVANQLGFRDNSNGRMIAVMSPQNLISQIGDINGAGNQSIETITDSTSTHDFSNGALNAVYSINGNAGASGSFLSDGAAQTITVEGGIITSIV